MRSLPERFWSKVLIGEPDQCWLWMGTRFRSGYGAFHCEERLQKAHRVAFRLAYGDIADSKLILHSCDVPPCCNPKHLREGTPADNAQDKAERFGLPKPGYILAIDRLLQANARMGVPRSRVREFIRNCGPYG